MTAESPALADVAAHVFVADLERPELEPDDRKHLEASLRLRPGEIISVSDGHGRWRRCRFGPQLEPVDPVQAVGSWEPRLTLGFSLVKGGRTELIVQKATELGIDRLLPIAADRCVVRWDGGRAEHQRRRLQRIAREAAMQSRRCDVPEVAGLARFDAVIAGAEVAVAHVGGEPLTLGSPMVVIGPEGGWTDRELELARHRIGLGPTVLRTETAAIAAAVVLTRERSLASVDV